MKIQLTNIYAYRAFVKDVALPCSLLLLLVLGLSALSDAASSDSQNEVLGKCFRAGPGIVAEKVVSTIFGKGVVL